MFQGIIHHHPNGWGSCGGQKRGRNVEAAIDPIGKPTLVAEPLATQAILPEPAMKGAL
jgi:hypothetical protein